MVSFLISIVLLVLGYIFYGLLTEKVFGSDSSRVTPAHTRKDGIDFIPMPAWRVFLIQLLNIAGTGPIFGAIAGAMFGPASFVWIVVGCIFMGAVHDYMLGMLSVRHDGAGLPEIIGHYLGRRTRAVMLAFSVILLILVGTVFVYSPAAILGKMTGGTKVAIMIWVGVILIYYIVATLVPVDKIIGKIYPLFAFALLFMAVSLFVCLVVKWPAIPEVWDGLGNRNPASGTLFPCLFISIACGAISGFHGTQSPIMARCLGNERLGRPIFYGSMIAEGLIALVWAAVASYYFHGGGIAAFGESALNPVTGAAYSDGPNIVTLVCSNWLGIVGSILAILGVVVAPITSGDTAFRSARLIVADAAKLDQKPVLNRLMICIPLFVVAGFALWYSIADADGFNIIWRYFGWANQTLASFTLWAVTVFLVRERGGRRYLLSFIPAVFMTAVCAAYIGTAKIGFNLPVSWTGWIGGAAALLGIALFYLWKCRRKALFN